MVGGADYLLAVKENQGHLYEDIYCLLEVDVVNGIEKAQHSYTRTINKATLAPAVPMQVRRLEI